MAVADQLAPKMPLHPEDITTEWLSATIGSTFPGVRVTSSAITEILDGTGTKVFVCLDYNEAGKEAKLPPSVVVKTAFNPEHRQLLKHCFVGEVRYYKEFLPQVAIEAPRCLFAGTDDEGEQHVVILEDLRLRGATFLDARHTLTFEQAARFLDGLARLHAKWWNSPRLAKGGDLAGLRHRVPFPPPGINIGDHCHRQLEPENWEKVCNLPRGQAISRVFHDREVMIAALNELNARCHDAPQCLLHGDTHLGNLYLCPDGSAGFLDFQALAKGSWARDVSYFLGVALDVADRRRWDGALISYYLERLAQYGATEIPGFDEAFDTYAVWILDGFFSFIINTTDMQPEVINTAATARLSVAALDLQMLERLG